MRVEREMRRPVFTPDLDRLQQRDAKEWRTLVDDTSGDLHRFAHQKALALGLSPDVSEDAVQRAYLKLFEKIDLIDSKKDAAWHRGWLAKAVIRYCIDLKRGMSRHGAQTLTEHHMASIPASERLLEDEVVSEIFTDQAIESLSTALPPVQHRVIELTSAGFRGVEIADIEGVDKATVRTRLNRARNTLKAKPLILEMLQLK